MLKGNASEYGFLSEFAATPVTDWSLTQLRLFTRVVQQKAVG